VSRLDRSTTARTGLRLSVVTLVVLFFQGCNPDGVTLTVGPVVSFAQFEYFDDDPLGSELEWFSWTGLLINLSVLAGAFFIAPYRCRRLADHLNTRRFHLALVLAATVFNSVLFARDLWTTLVFFPLAHVIDRVERDWLSSESMPIFVAGTARLYFVIWVLGGYALVNLALLIAERYLLFDRNRWWQVNLRTLLAVTFVTGTSLGLILRWMRAA